MGDRGQVAAAAAAVGGAGAGGRGGARGGGGGPGGGGMPGPLCTTHSLPWLLGNRNSNGTGQGKSTEKNQILVLTKKYRVANEVVNFHNQKLIDTYNEIWKAGDTYLYSSRKGGKNKREVINLEKNFLGIISNLKACRAAVTEAGGQPVPFPHHIYQNLPQLYQDALKKQAIV